MLRLSLLCTLAISAWAYQNGQQQDERALLLQLRQKVMLTVNRLPRYLCTETVDRSTLRPVSNVGARSCDDLVARKKKAPWRLHEVSSDRLRVDVAVSGASEMFSWVGENRFEDRSLAELVRRGTTSTGTFASLLTAVFGSDAARFTYNGDVSSGGRSLVEFGFRVPLDKSGFSVGNGSHSAIVPYEGTFLVDPKTPELVSMSVSAEQIPPEIRACADSTTLIYGIVKLNETDFLLPKDVRLHVLNVDGSEYDNRTVFSGCHEFRGESTLHFDDAADSGSAESAGVGSKGLGLPAGLPFTLALTGSINTATAASGDLVSAKLVSAIKGKHGRSLVSKEAIFNLRIVQFEHLYRDASTSVILGLQLESLQSEGTTQPFAAKLSSVVTQQEKLFGFSSVRQDLGSFDQMTGQDEPSAAFIHFVNVTPNYVIASGLEVSGFTLAAR